jgi:hypothetical protein
MKKGTVTFFIQSIKMLDSFYSEKGGLTRLIKWVYRDENKQ